MERSHGIECEGMNYRDFIPRIVRRHFVTWYPRYLRWRFPFDPSNVTFRETTGRTEIPVQTFRRERGLAVILAIGASNLGNEGDPEGLFEPAHGVYNFNFLNGKCYVAMDPLLGTTLDRGNVLTRLGARLVSLGFYQRVLLIPVAHGGTYR